MGIVQQTPSPGAAAERPAPGAIPAPAPPAETVVAELDVLSPRGLHARPATEIAALAAAYGATLQLTCIDADGAAAGQSVDAKSVLHLMMLAATEGTRLRLDATGSDAGEAVAAITAFFEAGFNE